MLEDYNDKQELQQEIRDDGKKIETFGEEQQEHQGDLEKIQEALQMLANGKGLYGESDRQLQNSVETAIQARETSVDIVKEKIREVQTEMEAKLENLKRSIDNTKQRTERMEQAVQSLRHKDDGVVSKMEGAIQDHRNDINDATDKAGSISDIINLASQIANVVNVSADAIGQIVSALQSLGLFQ